MKRTLKVFIILMFIGLFVTGCGKKAYSLNETADIKSNSIKLTILDSKEETVTDAVFDIYNGDYIKVNVKIENYGTETYEWSVISFNLGDEIPSLYSGNDGLKDSIPAGETATGYIYFKKTDSTELIYNPINITKTKTGRYKLEKFYFKIK